MIHRSNPAGVWGPRGRGFSMGVASAPGYTVNLTGQVAWDAEERIVGDGDVTEQTRQCFRNIQAVLADFGGTLEDVVSITTYYLAPQDLALIQQVRGEFLDPDRGPASISIQAAGLGHPEFLVELVPVAVIAPDRFKAPE
ncbi:MAG: RidA family protein [Pseudomonadota bacterium]